MDLAEVDARRRLDPVRPVPEVDRVQVLGHDPLLRPPAREVVGQCGLAQLLEDRPVVLFGQGVLDELLRDRRGALLGAAAQVGDRRARDPAQVDPWVGPEAPVLDRHDRPPHPWRDLLETVDHLVIRRCELPDQVPVIVVQVRVGRRRGVHLSVLDLREIGGDRHHHPEHGRDDRERAESDQDQDQPQLADSRLGPRPAAPAPEPSASRPAPASVSTPASIPVAAPVPAATPVPPPRQLRPGRHLRLIALSRDFDVVDHAVA